MRTSLFYKLDDDTGNFVNVYAKGEEFEIEISTEEHSSTMSSFDNLEDAKAAAAEWLRHPDDDVLCYLVESDKDEGKAAENT